ncbi:MAG: GAF domain-containing protein [Planctomycetota bacterium]|nr:GAF domain-containing protein [Planctomycetota bacterium]
MGASDPTPSPHEPWDEHAYSIKHHSVTIHSCDREPVHTPGCIQSHGVLLALDPHRLTVVQVSSNANGFFGRDIDDILGRNIADLVGDEATQNLTRVIREVAIENNPAYAFTIEVPRAGLEAQGRSSPSSSSREAALWLDATVHSVDGVLLLEMEPADVEVEKGAPQVWRRKPGHERGPGPKAGLGPEVAFYDLVKRTMTRLQGASSVSEFCGLVCDEVRALTGLDRVMVYRFHPDLHGEVIGESKRADFSSWLGLHYSADDIPAPAREIFKRIWIRPLPDAATEPAEMTPLTNPLTGRPLDMTQCALRGASVMYTEYLRNMGVAASLTMPIRRDGELWGLIACHHATPRHFSQAVRASCKFVAQVASLHLKGVEERDGLLYRLRMEGVQGRLVAAAAHEGGLPSMTDGLPTLLDAVDCGGAALFHRDRWWRVGATPSDMELDAIRSWLETRPEFERLERPVLATDELARLFPASKAYAGVASGLLATPLSRERRGWMMWFRPEVERTIRWAGRPDDKPVVVGPHGPRLTPRASFEQYVESVRGLSAPWSPVEVDAALRLRLMVMELVVGRAERLAQLNADLTRSNEELDAFAYVASHDLKEPLRGIAKYAQHLIDAAASLDEENRTRVEGLMRLTRRMDTLLDSLLHFSRVGRMALEIEIVDLNDVVAEALEMVSARREETPTEVRMPRKLPKVRCDRPRLREVYVNLISNALKYNDKPRRVVELGYAEGEEASAIVRPEICNERQRIYFVRDNGIGIERRHFAQVFQLFKRLHGRNAFGGGAGAGLTIVKRLVERHGGHIWIDSEPGVGTTFYFTLGENAEVSDTIGAASSAAPSNPTRPDQTRPDQAGLDRTSREEANREQARPQVARRAQVGPQSVGIIELKLPDLASSESPQAHAQAGTARPASQGPAGNPSSTDDPDPG